MIEIGRITRLTVAAVCMVLASISSSGAVHYGFKHIGSDDGMSGSYVKAIAQDSNGFIWIGTKNGLDRYDGVQIRTFQCRDNDHSRGNNNIGAVYEDSNRMLWVGTDRGVYIFDPSTEKFSALELRSPNGVRVEDWVQTILGDPHGNIWILAPNQGVFRYRDGQLEYYSVTNHNGDKEKIPISLQVTGHGTVYVGTNRQGLFFYDPQTNMFRRAGGKSAAMSTIARATIQYIEELPDGSLCLATQGGELYRFDPVNLEVRDIPFSRSGSLIFHSLECIDNELWLGTTEGVFIIDADGREPERELSTRTMGERSLSDNTINVITRDRDGNVWLGTMFGWVTYVQRTGLIFEKYCADTSRRGLTGNHVRGLAADSKGKIWVGTEGTGLNVLDPGTGEVKRLPGDTPESKIVVCMAAVDDNMYVGFVKGGCGVYNTDGQRVSRLGNDLLASTSDVYSIYQDRSGDLWLGASWGLYRRDNGSDEFRHIEDVGYGWIFDTHRDSKGMIWIASMGDGIWNYNPATGVYHHYAYDDAHSNGLRSNSISSITEDSKGRLWFSTDRGGLVLYNPSTDNFTSYGVANGLPDDTVYDVVEDGKGNLWFGTNRGLVKFNPDSGAVKVFAKGKQFSYHSAIKGADGRLYIGGNDGLLVFNPDADVPGAPDAPVFFTDFHINGTGYLNNASASSRNVLYADEIELAHDEGSFSVSVGSPYYAIQGHDRFVYRLLPASEEWTMVSDPRNLSFAGIPPGSYTLEVKRLGAEGKPRQLGITVLAPWYESWWANIIYTLLFLSMLGFGWSLYRRRQLEKLAEKEGIFTIEKEKELYKKKMQFFTEIAHEIRTPLTLIGTPLEAIEEIGVSDNRIKRYLKVIRQNTSRLLDLTGQILDFQKMDAEAHPLKFEMVDINTLVQEIVDRFEMTIANKNKQLTCHLPEHQVIANVDKDAVIKVLSNLFNNAMKYSDHLIEITLEAGEDTFRVSVKSDGEKITGENRYKIFEPFYQASNRTVDNGGVGIGLPLCRTLAHLHGGTIDLVDDNEPGFNTFRLTLPLKVGIDDPVVEASPVMAEYVLEEDSPVVSDNSSYTLLFVDDNEEMREFLYDQLSQNFVVETAANGVEALVKLKEHPFDIIVTDIMMPDMDGYELCKAIKSDSSLSPIPVVFLTAKNDLESKVRALECGGESYIEKPFSIKYFRQQIKSLLDNRRHERKAFLNKPFFNVDNMKMNKADEEFMSKVVNLINENIDKENFNVESMAEIFCMSRSSLLRKIKSLFQLSPVELIRIVRLKKAAELIQEGKYRMGDICFMVGINSQSYFTRLFFKQFGITPKAFEKQCQEKQRASGAEPQLPLGDELIN